MLDCEFVNRFLAFYLLGLELYTGNLEEFLNNVMIRLQQEPKEQIEIFRQDFFKAMKYANLIFGDSAFRKININGKYGRINKPLFDSISVNLAKLSINDCEKLLQNKSKLHGKYTALLQNKEFVAIITNGTAKIPNVQNRYRQIKNIFQEVLDDDSIYANRKF